MRPGDVYMCPQSKPSLVQINGIRHNCDMQQIVQEIYTQRIMVENMQNEHYDFRVNLTKSKITKLKYIM